MPSPTTIDAETGALIETETTSLTASLRTGIDTVNEHWRAAEHHHQQSCAHLIMAGHQLIQLRKEVPHGEWEPLFQSGKTKHEFRFAFTVQWARRLISMAEASKKQIPQLADLPFDSNLRDWSASDLQTLRESVAKRADGETFQQLSWDWGLAKKPQGSAAKGGNLRKDKGEDEETVDRDPKAEVINLANIHLLELQRIMFQTRVHSRIQEMITTIPIVVEDVTKQACLGNILAEVRDFEKLLAAAIDARKNAGEHIPTILLRK